MFARAGRAICHLPFVKQTVVRGTEGADNQMSLPAGMVFHGQVTCCEGACVCQKHPPATLSCSPVSHAWEPVGSAAAESVCGSAPATEHEEVTTPPAPQSAIERGGWRGKGACSVVSSCS